MNRDDLKTAVLFDRDSCLSLTRHRWHLSPSVDPDSNWDAYCAAAADDEPNPGVVTAAQLAWPHHQVHVCSGSNASAESVTRGWLTRHGVLFDGLRLRAAGDETPNGLLKVTYIMELRARGIEVVLAYEDWGPAARDIAELAGVPVVGVNPFYPEDAARMQQAAFDGMGGGL